MTAWELLQGSNTLMDPCRSNIGGPDPCDPCGVDAYASDPCTWMEPAGKLRSQDPLCPHYLKTMAIYATVQSQTVSGLYLQRQTVSDTILWLLSTATDCTIIRLSRRSCALCSLKELSQTYSSSQRIYSEFN